MPRLHNRRPGRAALQALFLSCMAAFAQVGNAQANSDSVFTVVAEMQRPPGIQAARKAERTRLAANIDGQSGLDAFRELLGKQWPLVRQLDVVAMSRYHVEATRGWQLPAATGDLPGRVIGSDDGDTALYLELQGPRLPASFDIVHRHLVFYARYQPESGTLDRVTATIRLEVFE